MVSPASSRKLVHFGTFEVDLEAAELRKQGVRVKLQDQPFKVLRLLLDRPGQIITRDELRASVWPAQTFVEFDQGLYSAMARLRDALGDSSESPRFIETVARRGYRFIAPITESPSPHTGTSGAKVVSRTEAHGHNFIRKGIAALFGFVLLLAFLLIANARGWISRRPARAIQSLAVLPLENLSDSPEQEYFADGMTDELITTLAQLGNLRVVSRTSVMQYKRGSKPVPSLPQIGRDLNVDAVVEGTVERSGSHIRIRVQLIQASTDRHLWAQSYDRELRDALLLESEAARDIAREIQSTLTPSQQQRLAAARQVDPDAYEAYLKGLYFSNKRSAPDFVRAIDYFQQAIAKEPRYARAYSGLTEAFFGQLFSGTPPDEIRGKATTAALKSVQLDDSAPEGHYSLGGIREFFDWNWLRAEEEYKRAIELNQNSATAHQAYSLFLVLQGRFDAGIAEAQRAQDLDPMSPFIRTSYCFDLYFTRRYDQGIQKCQQALAFEPNFRNAHDDLANIYEAKGMYDQAFEEHQIVARLEGRPASYTHALEKAFHKDGIRGLWREQLKLYEKSGGLVEPFRMALFYSRLGETHQAIACLQEAYQERWPLIELIKVDPRFDDLRADPRFLQLLRKTGLGQ